MLPKNQEEEFERFQILVVAVLIPLLLIVWQYLILLAKVVEIAVQVGVCLPKVTQELIMDTSNFFWKCRRYIFGIGLSVFVLIERNTILFLGFEHTLCFTVMIIATGFCIIVLLGTGILALLKWLVYGDVRNCNKEREQNIRAASGNNLLLDSESYTNAISIMKKALECLICLETITGDPVFCTNCMSIVACKACLDQWFMENHGLCPHCRSKFRINRLCVKGFGEVLEALKNID